MRLVSTPRTEFLRALATEIMGNYGRGRTIVAIDGTDASARESFAGDLAAVFEERDHPVFRASLRYFRRSRAEQERFGPDTPERHYRFGHDYSALRRVLVEPFRLGGSTGFVTRFFDPDRDAWIEPTWQTAPDDATLIVDGEFAIRRELRDLWSYRIFLDGEALEGEAETEADRLYLAEDRPREHASAVIDITDAARPRRVFLDSC